MQDYKLKIKDLPLEERPRERLMKQGVKALSNAELLAIIIRNGSQKENVVELSKRLLKKYNIKTLSRININKLKNLLGIGEAKACQIIACFELGRRLAAYKEDKKLKVENARNIAELYIPKLSLLKKEYFIGIYLNSRQRIIKEETIFIGSLDSSIIHPREIFQVAINEGAAAIILVHNHPSGNSKPSEDDVEITNQLIKGGNILGIEILDHIIIGDRSYFSFKEKGLLN